MTTNEFHDWLDYHQAAFPGIGSWLAKFDRIARSGEGLRSEDVLKSWRRVLGDIDLLAARKATDAMARGDLEEPRSFDGHAKAVRKAAKAVQFGQRPTTKPQPRYVDGKPVYLCANCLDTGLIFVWHPTSEQAARAGKLGQRFTRYSCGVRCTCEAGGQWRGINHAFDPAKMCPCDYHPTPADDAALLAFVANESRGTEWDGAGYTYDAFAEGS